MASSRITSERASSRIRAIPRHIGDDAPFDLHDREARVRRDIADVGAERDLETAAERDPMDRRNDGNGKRAPDICRLLKVIGGPVRPFRQIAERRPAFGQHRGECPLVEAGAKALAGAREHDGAQARGSTELSPAATIASNIAGSSALSLSGRLSVTSATPPAISIRTRSPETVGALSCMARSFIPTTIQIVVNSRGFWPEVTTARRDL